MKFPLNASKRMALQYSLVFAANGVSLPFIGLWLRAHGMDGAQIGVLLAAPMLGRLITGPAIALWADGFRHRRTAIVFLAIAGTAAFAAMPLTQGFGWWSLLWFVATTCSGAIMPLSDVLTMRLAAREGFAFSVPRGFGSAAFVAANVVMGALLVTAPVDAVIWWLIATGVMLALWARFGLPAEPVLEGGPARGLERFEATNRRADNLYRTRVAVDGAVLDADGRRAWRTGIAHVPQAIFLTADSLLANVAFGVPANAVDRPRAIEAIRLAQLDEVVAGLAQGIDSPLGERGARLSGGQRQRVGLARAIYRAAPVLVLDEATSALDPGTEAAVLRVLDALQAEGRTIIIIAHRSSALEGCDRVIRLEGGRVVENRAAQPVQNG